MIPGVLVCGTTLKLSVSVAYTPKWFATQIEVYDPQNGFIFSSNFRGENAEKSLKNPSPH